MKKYGKLFMVGAPIAIFFLIWCLSRTVLSEDGAVTVASLFGIITFVTVVLVEMRQ